MKNFLSFLFLLFAVAAFGQKQFVVDPDAVIRPFSGSFNSIKVSSGIRVYVSQGDEEAIAVSASEEKYRKGIKTEIENNELHIYYSGDRIRFGQEARIRVYVAFKNLVELQVSGASDIIIAGEAAVPLLSIHLSGASNLSGIINTAECNIRLSGASDAKLKGMVKLLNIENSGASDVKGYELTADNCNIKLSGASDVNITVTGILSVIASGASSIHYKGNPQFKLMQTSGASSITRVE